MHSIAGGLLREVLRAGGQAQAGIQMIWIMTGFPVPSEASGPGMTGMGEALSQRI